MCWLLIPVPSDVMPSCISPLSHEWLPLAPPADCKYGPCAHDCVQRLCACLTAAHVPFSYACRCDNLRLKFQQKDLDTDEWESVDSSAQVQHA